MHTCMPAHVHTHFVCMGDYDPILTHLDPSWPILVQNEDAHLYHFRLEPQLCLLWAEWVSIYLSFLNVLSFSVSLAAIVFAGFIVRSLASSGIRAICVYLYIYAPPMMPHIPCIPYMLIHCICLLGMFDTHICTIGSIDAQYAPTHMYILGMHPRTYMHITYVPIHAHTRKIGRHP